MLQTRAVDRAPVDVVGEAEAYGRRTGRVLGELPFDAFCMVISTREIGIVETIDDRAQDLLG